MNYLSILETTFYFRKKLFWICVNSFFNRKKNTYICSDTFVYPSKSHTADYGNTTAGVGSGTIDIHNWRSVGGIVIMNRYRCVRAGALPIRKYRTSSSVSARTRVCVNHPGVRCRLVNMLARNIPIVSHKTHLLPVDINCVYVCVFVAICCATILIFPSLQRWHTFNDSRRWSLYLIL